MNLEESLQKIERDLLFCRQLVQLQSAQIEALKQYVSAYLSKVQGVSVDEAYNTIQKIVRKVYDQQILHLGDKHPQMMEELDIRPLMDEEDRKRWEFPEFPDS